MYWFKTRNLLIFLTQNASYKFGTIKPKQQTNLKIPGIGIVCVFTFLSSNRLDKFLDLFTNQSIYFF